MLHGDEICQVGAVFTCQKRDAYHTRLCVVRANCAIFVVGKKVAAGIRQALTDLNVGAVGDDGREALHRACRLDRDAGRDSVGRRADTGRRRAGSANRCRPRRSRDCGNVNVGLLRIRCVVLDTYQNARLATRRHCAHPKVSPLQRQREMIL